MKTFVVHEADYNFGGVDNMNKDKQWDSGSVRGENSSMKRMQHLEVM